MNFWNAKPETVLKKFFLLVGIITISVSLAFAQIDSDVTEKTSVLYSNLKTIQNSNNFLFGQEFFNSFKFSSGGSHGEETYSDCFAVTGVHPAVLGSDFHYNLEKDATERGYQTEAVKWAYQHGYVITFDWHVSARGTTSYEYQGAPANLANNIATIDGEDRAWYLGELDKVIDIINDDLVVNAENIPIVFRPLHEMNGNWFWWGSAGISAANYKLLYQLTVDYVKERTTSVLFCWSPNSPFNLGRTGRWPPNCRRRSCSTSCRAPSTR
jgi:mannan endo-1,4-beta-mannosidase